MKGDAPGSGGRFPDHDILGQRAHWDEATRRLILDRVYNVPPIRFFTAGEAALLQAVADTILPQDDRPPERRIPIVPYIDDDMVRGAIPGYRFEGMPDERTGWRWGLEGIDETSMALFERLFLELDGGERREVLVRIQRGDPPGEVWRRLPAERFFSSTLTTTVVGAYYAHPWAWDEIGYGGPAYPRGYYGLNYGARERWEVEERR